MTHVYVNKDQFIRIEKDQIWDGIDKNTALLSFGGYLELFYLLD